MPSPATTPVNPAEAAALRLAAEAGALDLAAAAASPEEGTDTLATLLAHELATGHRLMMRLAARAENFLDHAAAEAQSPDERRAGLEAARLAGAAGRLMERYRLGLLALHKLRAPGPGEKAEQVVRLVWAGCPSHRHPAGTDSPEDDPGGDGPDSDGPGGVPSAAPSPSPPPASAQSAAPLASGPRAAVPLGRRRGRLRNGNPSGDYLAAPRCGARTRAGGCCRQPAMANGRCRLHGGRSTGPRSAAGLRRCRTARLRHGARSVPLAALRRAAAASARRLRLLTAVGDGAGRGIPAGHGVHRPKFAHSEFTPGRAAPDGAAGQLHLASVHSVSSSFDKLRMRKPLDLILRASSSRACRGTKDGSSIRWRMPSYAITVDSAASNLAAEARSPILRAVSNRCSFT